MCRKKKEMHRKLDRSKLNKVREYESLRNEFKNLPRIKYQLFTEEVADEIRQSSKAFFDFVNVKKKSKKFPSSTKYENLTSSDPEKIANMFALFFSSVYEPESFGRTREAPGCPKVDISCLGFTKINIFEGIMKIDGSKGAGPDGIPPKLIKYLALSICSPLKIVFNLSLKLGVFPSIWKVSDIVAIFKKGERSNVKDYRSIAIQMGFAKLFDMMVFDEIRPLINRQLTENQHGFRKKKSTTSKVVIYTSEITKALENGHEVHAIYTDFSKAFDKVSHRILVDRLNCFGFSGPMLERLHRILKIGY